jgi:hypothetical protein
MLFMTPESLRNLSKLRWPSVGQLMRRLSNETEWEKNDDLEGIWKYYTGIHPKGLRIKYLRIVGFPAGIRTRY